MSHSRLDSLLKNPVEGWFPRMAEEADFLQLAELFNIANAGSIPALWNPDAPEGQTWVDMLKPMMFEHGGELDHKSIAVADVGGRAVGMLVINTNPNPWPDEDYSVMKPYVVPFSKMRSLVPGYLFLRIIAVFPEFRGLRIATNLLDIAFNASKKNNLPGTFVTVHDSNVLQIEHYRKRGMVEISREKVIQHAVYAPDSDWIVLSIDGSNGFLPEQV